MDDRGDADRLAKLHMIAAMIGIPVGSFCADTEAAERIVGAGECVRLWDRIKTTEGRRRALAYLSELADEPYP